MTLTDRLPDLNLLRLFVALVEERHVTRAGNRLFLSQPAASGGLKRLREQFGDPLLVREGHELRVTERAQELYAAIAPRLEELAGALNSVHLFDPAVGARTFSLGCTDAMAFAILPPLLAALRQEAPRCEMILRVGDYRSLPTLLAHGETGAVLGYLGDDLPANARMRVLHHAHWLALRDPATPPVATLDSFCARPHVLVRSRGELHGMVDNLLQQQGRSRRVVLGLTSFTLLSAALPGSDMVSTVPDFVAHRLTSRFGLAADIPPIAPPVLPNILAWGDAQDRNPAERWFRDQVVAAFSSAFGQP